MTKKLWGGRFSKKIDPLVEDFTKSIDYDYKLAKADLVGSMMHVSVLGKANFLTREETNKLFEELKYIFDRVENGRFKWNKKCEDIHTAIQNELQKKVGELALKLHTARSRNDQVVFATKLYCKNKLKAIESRIAERIEVLEELLEANKEIIIPGFTHMQHAQPVYLKDYLGVYVEMLKRDKGRFQYISKNMKVTLGAGALAGTPISAAEYAAEASEFNMGLQGQYQKVISEVNIEAPTNSLDTVSDRDFVIEILSALAILGMHLSRMAEDFIIWATKEFDFIEIDEAFCTGSSLMPQKKNADVLELIRGYAGRLCGNLVSVLTMMKGLPLTYNRDMQLDKEPLFESFEIVEKELKVLPGLIKTLKFNKDIIKKHLEDESLYATDFVYYLIGKGIPFSIAHEIIGKLVKYSLENNRKIKDMSEAELKKFSDKINKDELVKLIDPVVSVESRKSVNRTGGKK